MFAAQSPRSRPAARDGRPGAPLWALVEFADGIDDARRAGLEGALEGAGLLDAWVMPDGAVLDADDAMLVPGESGALGGRTLADALVAVRDAPVPAAVVAGVLARLALSDSGSSEGERPGVGLDGSFALGPLRGRRRVDAARFIGAAARAAARARRLTELAQELAAIDRRELDLAARADELEAAMARLRDELRRLPDDAPAIRAHVKLSAARDEEQRAAAVTAAEQETMTARAAALAAARECAVAHAREHRLPAPEDEAGLAAIRDALACYRGACSELIGGERARVCEQQDSASTGAHQEASAAVGASVEQLRARLAALEAQMSSAERGLEETQRDEIVAASEAAAAERDSQHAAAALAGAERDVAAKHAGVASLGRLGAWLLALGDAAPEDHADAGGWPLDRTLAALRSTSREALAARRGLETLLGDVDREADELRHRLSASAEFQVSRERVPDATAHFRWNGRRRVEVSEAA